MIKILRLIPLIVPLFQGCISPSGRPAVSTHADSAVVDTFFTGIFSQNCDGFTGGDGTYSVELPDGGTAWIFGDTFIGGLNPDNTREHQEPKFIRNSLILMQAGQVKTFYRTMNGQNASFQIHPLVQEPQTELTEDSVWFWPGDGLVEDGKLKIFFSEFAQVDTGMWGFSWLGTWIASYPIPRFTTGSLEAESLELLPFSRELDIHFGHAVLEEKAYTYVYGLGGGQPHAARYPSGNVHGSWEFFTGGGWSRAPADARPMAAFEGSEQFSVFKLKGLYVMITQMGGFSDEICSFTSVTPFGPWENRQLLYKTPLPAGNTSLITYNALAHPQFTSDGMLLVSYNMNSLRLEDHYLDAGIYRPRFIRVPVHVILGEPDTVNDRENDERK